MVQMSIVAVYLMTFVIAAHFWLYLTHLKNLNSGEVNSLHKMYCIKDFVGNVFSFGKSSRKIHSLPSTTKT